MEPKTVRRANMGQKNARLVAADQACNALPLGTIVQTLDGLLPVEFLEVGDRVITRNQGFARLRELRVSVQTVPAIRVQAGTLGNMRPDCTVDLPANHQVLVRDWRAKALFSKAAALAPAEKLVDGEFIQDQGLQVLELYSLHFAADQVIFAGGLELACGAQTAPLGKAA
jgi:hypothetical protein